MLDFSTLVLADAIKKNESTWKELAMKPEMGKAARFVLHSVDGGKKWIEATREILTAELESHVRLYSSVVIAGEFENRLCHYYENLPDVVPDFLYIDGPDPATVQGDVRGQTWRNASRVVMSADLLSLETTLMPGALVLIDGRTANARFLAAHLYRNWATYQNPSTDVSVMELQEKPLGVRNH